MSSPTQRSKKLMEDDGYIVGIVEKFNFHAKVRQDLYGIFDLLGIGKGTLAVQTTTADHMAERRTKMRNSTALQVALDAGWKVELHGWHKVKNRWQCKREVITNGCCS